jgi:glutamate synthase domain-containing protein 1
MDIESHKQGALTQSNAAKHLGMYEPKFEHDSCGIGLLVNIDGHRSHRLVKDATLVLMNMAHRGGVGA